MKTRSWQGAPTWLWLALLVALALALRLLVWRWHEQVALGGDETEYFNAALALLRERRYQELQFMRPPLYTLFLASNMYILDSLVQRLRLVQAIISAATVLPVYALTATLFGVRRVALAAALLCALSYTLAFHATELLAETVFVFGLTVCLWLLAAAHHRQRARLLVALAGVAVGLLALTRSVALPLLPLGALWLWLMRSALPFRQRAILPLVFVLAGALVIVPWTARNYLTYGAPILIDTTGAENLWLDNNPAAATAADPLGREAAKQTLYGLGDDRAARQQLATTNGMAAITGNPAWFVGKAWGEAQTFWALQFFDDFRARRAIWVPPAEVWLALLLGDGLWLLLALAGIVGMWSSKVTTSTHDALRFVPYVGLIFGLWALYIFVTSLLFHVELRYRLPLWPVLLPFAALALAGGARRRWQVPWRAAGAVACCFAVLVLMWLHRPYLAETIVLTQKHAALAQADTALRRGDAAAATDAAQTALNHDNSSVLARVTLARAALAEGNKERAKTLLDDGANALRAHPYPHLLRGALLRAEGQMDAARDDLTFERATREDVQQWAWDVFVPLGPPPATLDVGNGLDLGYVHGFALAEDNARWTLGAAQMQLHAEQEAHTLVLELAAGRPANAPLPTVSVQVDGQSVGAIDLRSGWNSYTLPLPTLITGTAQISLASPTFRPRDYDRSSPDGRTLGVLVRRATLQP